MWKLVRPVLLLAVILLVSCAGVPKPEGDSDSLVVGSFVVDFADDFFGMSARTIDSQVLLDIANNATGKSFRVTTAPGGYFYFLSNGQDNYAIKGYSWQVKIDNGTYSDNGRFTFDFVVKPHCVYYLGHLKLILREGRAAASGGGGRSQSWDYKYSSAREDRQSEAEDFLRKTAKDSPWLDYDVTQ